VNDAGDPVANQTVRILDPELAGPMAQSLRTNQINTDSDGVLYLEGLAAGKHTLQIESPRSEFAIVAPPLGSPMKTPEELRVPR
jgi:hypothetical protein